MVVGPPTSSSSQTYSFALVLRRCAPFRRDRSEREDQSTRQRQETDIRNSERNRERELLLHKKENSLFPLEKEKEPDFHFSTSDCSSLHFLSFPFTPHRPSSTAGSGSPAVPPGSPTRTTAARPTPRARRRRRPAAARPSWSRPKRVPWA